MIALAKKLCDEFSLYLIRTAPTALTHINQSPDLTQHEKIVGAWFVGMVQGEFGFPINWDWVKEEYVI
jgi:hypothetical protein